MPDRLEGFYIAKYEGLNDDARWGFGTLSLKGGKVYGGDSLSFFLGEYEDQGEAVVARVKVYPLVPEYHSVTDIENKAWDLPDIRGNVAKGALPPNVQIQLDGQRYDTKNAVTILLTRMVGF